MLVPVTIRVGPGAGRGARRKKKKKNCLAEKFGPDALDVLHGVVDGWQHEGLAWGLGLTLALALALALTLAPTLIIIAWRVRIEARSQG